MSEAPGEMGPIRQCFVNVLLDSINEILTVFTQQTGR